MMTKRLTYIQSLQLIITLLLCFVSSQATGPIDWAIGSKLALFTTTESSCPLAIAGALSNSTSYTQVFANTTGTVSGGAVGSLATTFYITNGWHTLGTPFSDQTAIKVGEPDAVGGGCLNTADSTVTVEPCDESKNQTFYVTSSSSTAPFDIFTSTLEAVQPPSGSGEALTFASGGSYSFCAFSNATGQLISPPADSSQRYIPQSQLTNLTATSLNNSILPSEVDISACNWATGNTTNALVQSLASADCTVARAFSSMPAGCDANPENKTCILHLFPAFCIDLSSVRNGLNASDDVESCLRKISQGPCVANPGGAACASNLFAGITFVVSSGGGSSSSKRSNGPLFGDQGSDLPLEDQFWIGVAKNLINSGIGAFKFFTAPFVEEFRTSCAGATRIAGVFDNTTAQSIRSGCQTLFTTYNKLTPLTYDNNIEEAGSVFADVVSLLSLAGDIAAAAKSVGFVEKVVAKFASKSATISQDTGLVLEAVQGENTVQIFRDAGDGTAQLLYTDSDVAAMEKSVEDVGFENCQVCVEKVGTREISHSVYRRAGSLRKLCCFLSPQTVETPEEIWDFNDAPATDPAIPITSRVIGDITKTTGLSADEDSLLTTMTDAFGKFYGTGTDVAVTTDPISQAFFNAAQSSGSTTQSLRAAKSLYGQSEAERFALGIYVQTYDIDTDAMASAFAQMDGTTGTVYRATELDTATMTMLNNGAAGLQSQGTAGVYEVQDLVINNLAQEPVRQIMSTSLGLRDDFPSSAGYRFVINSQSGRYISPVVGSGYQEVTFMQGTAGKFKLLGRQELNGGEAAKAEGKPGPYGVYFFDEIDPPTLNPRICGGSVTTDCRAATLAVPTFT